MDKNIMVFNFKEYKIRVIHDSKGIPCFAADDICRALDLNTKKKGLKNFIMPGLLISTGQCGLSMRNR